MNILMRFFSDLLVTIFTIICWNECLGKKIRDNFKKNILLIIFQTLIIVLIGIWFKNPIKMIVTYTSLIIINYLSTSKNIGKSLIMVIISEIIILFSEITFAVIVSALIEGDIQKFTQTPLAYIALNIYISLFAIITLKINIPQKVFRFMCEINKTIKNNESLAYSIIIIIVIITSTAESYMSLSLSISLIINTIMAVIFIAIVIKISKVKSNLKKVSDKYQTSMNSLKEHELVIDKLRINGHENKNELLIIRNMINDKKTINYIDKLIDNKIKDNEKIMKKTVKIPKGGLRSTIYSKMCLMDKYKINYQLHIAKDVRTTDLINLDDEIILNICKILGVFLDNSIEAVKDLKEKQITIEIYKMDDKLNIEITNNFKGNLENDKISKTKYSTKGDGHGYGLSLASKIISENNNILENEREINGNNFTQILKIKM